MKKLGLNAGALSDDAMLDLMAEHPTLIRRPLLAEGAELVVGFDRGWYAERFGE